MAETANACRRCDGCGWLANTEDQEPWTAWEQLPSGSDMAVRMGLVQPVACHECNGEGRLSWACGCPDPYRPCDNVSPLDAAEEWICDPCIADDHSAHMLPQPVAP